MEYDVRHAEQKVNIIRFSDDFDKAGNVVAATLSSHTFGLGVCIGDGNDDWVFVADKTHAENLIKALNKAIALNWLE